MTSNTEGQITEAVLDEVFAERCHLRDEEGWKADDIFEIPEGQLAVAAAHHALHALAFWDNPEPPKDRRQLLLRAAALLVAEIERLDRIAELTAPIKARDFISSEELKE